MASLIRKKINPTILSECRDQVSLDLKEASKKARIPKLSELEDGKIDPTLKQLDTLASLYLVPTWVFAQKELPKEYNLDLVDTEFRKFKKSKAGSAYRTCAIIRHVMESRDLILSLRDEEVFPIEEFNPPTKDRRETIVETADSVRKWLGVDCQTNYTFDQWREKCEEKDIFIFTTYGRGWSDAKQDFRGFVINRKKLPVIVINSADYYKSQSFTLFHELGHLLLGKSNFDSFEDQVNDLAKKASDEEWCDRFASELLIPIKILNQQQELIPTDNGQGIRLPYIEKKAKIFKVSPLAFATSLAINDFIDWDKYNQIKKEIKNKRDCKLKQVKDRTDHGNDRPDADSFVQITRRPRQMYESTVKKYGKIYLRTLLQAYYDEELTLAKLYRFLDIKEPVSPAKLKQLCL